MEYKGKLYGRLGSKNYFETGKTADDFDALESRIKELENEKNICVHPYKYLERNENGLFCNKCKQQVSKDPNIY